MNSERERLTRARPATQTCVGGRSRSDDCDAGPQPAGRRRHSRARRIDAAAPIVHKYGGTSLADTTLIRAAAARIAAVHASGAAVVVTVSAMGDETDRLLALAPPVPVGSCARELDLLICSGEHKAVALLCMALRELGLEADGYTGAQAGIQTNAVHTNAAILDVRPTRILASLAARRVPVVSGAQGASPIGDTTFLGRGGSDTSAVALAAALGASTCELYTDVAGVCSADPRLVSDARLLPRIGYDEMLAMSVAGCPKPAARAVALARRRGIEVHVRSASQPEPGTLIGGGDAPVTAVVATPPGVGAEPDLVMITVLDARLHGEVAHTAPGQALAQAGIHARVTPAPTAGARCEVAAADAERAVRVLHTRFAADPASFAGASEPGIAGDSDLGDARIAGNDALTRRDAGVGAGQLGRIAREPIGVLAALARDRVHRVPAVSAGAPQRPGQWEARR